MPNVPGEISIDDVERFHRDGYVVLRNFFDRTAASQIKELSDQFSSKAAAILRECSRQSESPGNRAARSADELIVVPEATDQSMVCRYEYMIGSSVDFRQLVGTFVVPTVSVFLSEPAVPFKDKTNEKHPGGGRFGPHQDSVAYQHFGPRYNITALLSVHTATRANGCLQFAENFRELVKAKPEAVKSVIEGRSILHYCDGGTQNGNIIPEIAKDIVWASIETDPSDLVVFDSYVPHYSEPNRGTSPRRAILITFNAQREGDWYQRYYEAKRTNYHNPIFHISTPTWRQEIKR